MAASNRDVTRGLAVQNLRFIPNRGNLIQEFHPRIVVIIFGVIREHHERAFENHVHGQLMGPGSLAHRFKIPGLELLACGVVEAARRVVHGTGEHAREGNGDVMFGRHAVAPLAVFHAHHAFAGEEIRISPAQAGGFVRSVKIHNQMMFRRLADQALIEVHHLLIVVVHEIHFDPGSTPLRIEVQRLIHLLVHRPPIYPQQHFDTLLFRVSDDLWDVHLRDVAQNIVRVRVILCRVPTRIHEHVLKVMLGSEIDVVLHGRSVHARLEADVARKTAGPPIPSRLAGLDPGSVRQGRRSAEVQDEIVGLDQAARAIVDQEHAPRGRLGRGTEHRLIHAVAGRRKSADQGILKSRNAADVHAGVVGEIGFQESHPGAAGNLHEQREVDDGGRLDEIQLRRAVLPFVAGVEAAQVQGKSRDLTREVKAGVLRQERELFESRLLRQEVAEGGAFVVGAEDQVNTTPGRLLLLERNPELVVMVGDVPLGAERVRPRVGVGMLVSVDDFKVMVQRGRAIEVETQR